MTRQLIPVAMTMLLVACNQPGAVKVVDGNERVITGAVTYRERMSMPPDSIINVTLEDVSVQDVKSILMAEQQTTSDGRQVPIPFELRVDQDAIVERNSYSLRASIHAGSGELLWVSDTAHPALTRGASDTGNELTLKKVQSLAKPEPPPARVVVYNCESNGESFQLITEQRDSEIALWLPESLGGEYTVLPHVAAASGVKYQSDQVLVWLKGDEAMVEASGITYSGCQKNVHASIWEGAKLSGVDYRAAGNEPGWHLEIRNGETLTLVYDYGDSTVVMPAPEPVVDQDNRNTSYNAKADDHELTLVIKGEPCNDTMSDELFESSVTVTLDATTFRGCGRALH